MGVLHFKEGLGDNGFFEGCVTGPQGAIHYKTKHSGNPCGEIVVTDEIRSTVATVKFTPRYIQVDGKLRGFLAPGENQSRYTPGIPSLSFPTE